MKKLLILLLILWLTAASALGEGLPEIHLDTGLLDYMTAKPGALRLGDFSTPVTVKYRGAYSFSFTGKRNYTLHLKDEAGDQRKVSLLGLRWDDDYVLLGGLSDLSRLRSPVGLSLWRELGYNAPRSAPCELYFGPYYKGIYFLFERPDRKSAGVPAGGALYRVMAGAAGGIDLFTADGPPPAEGDTWYNVRRIYPEADGWTPLAALLRNEAAIDPIAFADYYLFINLIGASDNMSKNLFLCWDGERFRPMPWDLDAAFGRLYNAEPSDPEAWYSAPLFDGLLAREGFAGLLRERWAALREALAPDAVMERFEASYQTLEDSGAWEREIARFPEYTDFATGVTHTLNPREELAFIRDFLARRFALVDARYGGTP